MSKLLLGVIVTKMFLLGPIPLPFIGNLHVLFRHEPGYSAYEMWRKKYGPIYTYWIGETSFGSHPFIMISDYKTIRDTFVKDGEAYAGKFHFNEARKLFRGGDYGVVETVGHMWRDHRRFAIHVLRDLGLSKDVMERRASILAEVEAMSESLHAMKGKEIAMQDIFDVGVGSVINQLLFGYRFEGDNLKEFRELKGMISRHLKEFSHPSGSIMFLYPWLKILPYFENKWKKLVNVFFLKTYHYFFQPRILFHLNTLILHREAFFSFFDRQIEAHQKDIDFETEESNDYVEAFLKEKRRREANGDSESFSYLQLQNMCLDLWIAGMETTSNTLSWGVVYLLNNLHVQEKLHEEMDREIGSGRLVTMSDRNNLPYTSAVINEIQRMANLLPMNLPHQTLCTVQVGKWSIPAHTGVIAQISNVLYDDEVFPSPHTFDPSRFIDDSGRLKKVEELIPFSIGKRQCLGEGLARMELFLFIANLFNRFKLSCVNADEPPSMKKLFALTVQPRPYRCLAEPRFD
uniref:Unspecific monooxygenase n=1 Tax=Angiostrongylus cantonensis TaxID=6313 RepID=A0A0K0D0S0_ANGCA